MRAITTNAIPEIIAILLRVNSIDFLDPYSLVPPAPPIPKPSQPLGLIKSTDIINTTPITINATIREYFISASQENKLL